ncbi:hypothetical protein K439DRAFT_1648407 [Ramaria rubella]|nr:hypothetical protein K439DRAFT_1648407 [Ramaria rubella]
MPRNVKYVPEFQVLKLDKKAAFLGDFSNQNTLGNRINPSIFCPHILATEHVTKWTSPFAIQHRQLLDSHFPSSHIHQMQDIICASVIKKTRGNWGASILQFNQYCDSIHVPEEGCMPAPEILLRLFVANCGAGLVTDDCISSWLAGIHRWHQIHDAPWFGDKAISLVIKGTSRLVPEESHRPTRSPVSIQHIECLCAHLYLSNTFNTSVFAIATIAFYGCCQLGELTIPSRVAHNGRLFTTIHIPWSKTHLGKGNNLHLINTQSSSSPISALEHHLVVNSNIPHNAPLFTWHTATDTWEPMTKEWFMHHCNNIFCEHNLQVIDGHNFCIRGTMWLLLLGIDPWIIKVIGRWSSAALLLYWRKIEHILLDFVSDAYHSTQSLSSRMSQFVSNL